MARETGAWIAAPKLDEAYYAGKGTHPTQIPASVAKALAFDLTGVIPNHGDRATPEIHLERMRRLAESR